MAVEQTEVLQRIDVKLGALLAIAVEDLLRRTPELASPRPRSIDQLLNDAGLNQAEIGKLLGKTPQAVSQQLAGKKAKSGSKRATARSGGHS